MISSGIKQKPSLRQRTSEASSLTSVIYCSIFITLSIVIYSLIFLFSLWNSIAKILHFKKTAPLSTVSCVIYVTTKLNPLVFQSLNYLNLSSRRIECMTKYHQVCYVFTPIQEGSQPLFNQNKPVGSLALSRNK